MKLIFALTALLAAGPVQAEVEPVLERLRSQISPGYFGSTICMVIDEVRNLDELKEVISVFPGETLTTALDRTCDNRTNTTSDDKVPVIAALTLDRGVYRTLIADIARDYRANGDVATFERLINTPGEMSGFTALDYIIYSYSDLQFELSDTHQQEVDGTIRVYCLFGGQTAVLRQPDGCQKSNNL